MTAGHGHAHDLPPSSVLRERGRRLTVQRAAIWDVLTAASDLHVDAETVAERVRERLPHLNASTVYRTLDVLVDEGLVSRTDLGADRAYFEPAHVHRHHHLVCERCAAVCHVHDDVFRGLERRLAQAHGFVLGRRELTVFGTCTDCTPDLATNEPRFERRTA
jgi:Fur family ferric uptake transcriptional regulator